MFYSLEAGNALEDRKELDGAASGRPRLAVLAPPESYLTVKMIVKGLWARVLERRSFFSSELRLGVLFRSRREMEGEGGEGSPLTAETETGTPIHPRKGGSIRTGYRPVADGVL